MRLKLYVLERIEEKIAEFDENKAVVEDVFGDFEDIETENTSHFHLIEKRLWVLGKQEISHKGLIRGGYGFLVHIIKNNRYAKELEKGL